MELGGLLSLPFRILIVEALGFLSKADKLLDPKNKLEMRIGAMNGLLLGINGFLLVELNLGSFSSSSEYS